MWPLLIHARASTAHSTLLIVAEYRRLRSQSHPPRVTLAPQRGVVGIPGFPSGKKKNEPVSEALFDF